MAKQYYNPHHKQQRPIDHDSFGVEMNYEGASSYIDNNKWLNSKLLKASTLAKIRIVTLKAVLRGVVITGKGAFTTASQKTIAKKANLSVSSVKKSIYALRVVGVLYVEHRYSKEKATRRRISSITKFKAYLGYFNYLVGEKLKASNALLIATGFAKKCVETGMHIIEKGQRIDFDTGEIVGFQA